MTTEYEKNMAIEVALGNTIDPEVESPRDFGFDLVAIVNAAHELHFIWNFNSIFLNTSILSAYEKTYKALN